MRVRLVLGERGFEVARAVRAPVVVIRAETAALLRLARGEDDADRLFFERRLVMEGDTEFALLLKNTLDASARCGGRPRDGAAPAGAWLRLQRWLKRDASGQHRNWSARQARCGPCRSRWTPAPTPSTWG